MSDQEHRLIICTFDATEGDERAQQVQRALTAWDRHTDTVRLGNVAVVQKNSDGTIRYRETNDIHRELSDIAGIAAGAVSWFIYAIAGAFGPVAEEMARYQSQNAVSTLLGDAGFPDGALAAVGEALDAGSFALITLVREGDVSLVEQELAHLGGHILTHPLPPDVMAQLARGAK
ncbi:MAG: DUF1269 domain-containing protein [Chloroflexaceae bacterium]|nr:DUF1269 domain-containing protein [Chloroflexaceae bacterium]